GWHGLDAEGGLSVEAVAVKHGQSLRVSPWHLVTRMTWDPVPRPVLPGREAWHPVTRMTWDLRPVRRPANYGGQACDV
ncbi:MAG: hypothetical protein KAX80_03305, partial [Planctomycetes bacterium]|nr:hypothetical protein [Planctomycetota bacterium]